MDWLVTGMFKNEPKPGEAAKKVLDELGSHALTLSHARHISIEKALALGLKVTTLESDQQLQEAVLTVHHACVQTLTETPALKIIENHMGVAFISSLQTTLRANNDETLTAAIITEQGGKENHRERDQDCGSFCSQFT